MLFGLVPITTSRATRLSIVPKTRCVCMRLLKICMELVMKSKMRYTTSMEEVFTYIQTVKENTSQGD